MANFFGGSVSVFDTAHGNAALAPIVSSALSRPVGVAIAPDGKLYVTAGSSAVNVFDTKNKNAALPAITGTDLNFASALALDASGRLYVLRGAASRNGSFPVGISVFDTLHANAPLPSIPLTDSDTPADVKVGLNARVFVPEISASVVRVFDTANGNAPLTPIGGFNLPNDVAVDALEKLYVATMRPTGPGSEIDIEIFDTANGNALVSTISTGISLNGGIAVK